jgi:protein TonB
MSRRDRDPDATRRRELRRFVAMSALIHAGLILVFALSPTDSRSALPPAGVVIVDLIPADALPGRRKKPRAKPKPKPPPPVEKVVLPAEPAAPEPPPVEPAPAPEPEPAPPAAEDVDYEDFLDELRSEREDDPASQQVASLPGVPTGAPIDPHEAAWLARVRGHMRRNWILPPGFRTQRLQARIRVRLDPDGHVMGEPQLIARSGNRHYDETAMRAIAKADPLPPPPRAGEWVLVFDPQDLL